MLNSYDNVMDYTVIKQANWLDVQNLNYLYTAYFEIMGANVYI